jgi:hypothetical protein
MSDRPTFETQLRLALSSYASDAPVDVDAVAMAAYARKAPLSSRSWALRRRWLTPALLGCLLLAAAAGIYVGSRLLQAPDIPDLTIHSPLTIDQTDTMSVTRSGAAAVDLGDGRILVVGGDNGYPPDRGPQYSAEIYDPTTGTFTVANGRMSEGRSDLSATRLRDGRVLVLGGRQSGSFLASADVFDPETGTFTPLGPMGAARAGHAAVLLRDGRVAIIGGETDPGIASESVAAKPDVEYYDPTTAQYVAGPSDRGLEWLDPTAAVMPDGRILIGRGALQLGVGAVGGPVILDPTTGRLTVAIDRPDSVVADVVTLHDGRAVIATAGVTRTLWRVVRLDGKGFVKLADLPGAPVAPLTTLADGRVLILVDEHCEAIDAYVLDVDRKVLTKVGPIDGLGDCDSWGGTTVTALPSGGALIAGGNVAGGETSADAWLVQPSAAP